MAIYYKDFNGKVRTVVAGKAPFPLANNSTIGGVKVTGSPGESAPYNVMSEGALDGKLFDYAKKEHTHLMKDIYQLDKILASKADKGHNHDDRYPDNETFGLICSNLQTTLEDKISSHTHSEYLTKTQAGKVYQPKSAMALYATKEDLKKVGSTGYLYMLAAMDTTASQVCLDSLRKYERIEDVIRDSEAMTAVINSSAAMMAVANSSIAMTAVINSSATLTAVINSSAAMTAVANSSIAMTVVANSSAVMTAVANSSIAMTAVARSSIAITALFNSKNKKKLEGSDNIYGRFLPLIAENDYRYVIAFNTKGTSIGTELGGWLRANINDPIATQIRSNSSGAAIYYDLDAK